VDSTNCITNQLSTGTVQARGMDILSVCQSGCPKTDMDQRDLIASLTWDVKLDVDQFCGLYDYRVVLYYIE
jgi:hypothetical protein